jgi:hypothetical protein
MSIGDGISDQDRAEALDSALIAAPGPEERRRVILEAFTELRASCVNLCVRKAAAFGSKPGKSACFACAAAIDMAASHGALSKIDASHSR